MLPLKFKIFIIIFNYDTLSKRDLPLKYLISSSITFCPSSKNSKHFLVQDGSMLLIRVPSPTFALRVRTVTPK